MTATIGGPLLALAFLSCKVNAFLFPAPRASSAAVQGGSRASVIPAADRARTVPGASFLWSTTQGTDEEQAVRLEDRDVPQAHRGLHDSLYGDNEDHGATAEDGSTESFDGTEVFKVSEWLQEYKGTKHAGVYAVVGVDGEVNYVGLSRNVALSVLGHVHEQGGDKVDSIMVRSFKFPKRAEMEAFREEWIAACGGTPPGNQEGQEWSSRVRDVFQGAMTPEQKAAYEETKLKMRKAMADTTLTDELEQLSSEEIERRRRLELAVTGDDWSGVIDGQTAKTIDPKMAATGVDVASAQIISPFGPDGLDIQPVAGAGSGAATAGPDRPELDFTMENVDQVLNEVRPYLIADGGNVRVVAVDEKTRVVSLALQGACGSCPSSTTTMKMGIERVLNENFADLGGVEQVDEAGQAMGALSAEVVEAILEPLRPAMKAMKAEVTVLGVHDGVARLSYKGHRQVAKGLEMALMDNPLIRKVEIDYVE